MQVGLIKDQNGNVMGVVEWPEEVPSETIMRNWVASMSLSESAILRYRVSAWPVTPWDELRRVLVAFCDQQWMIQHDTDPGLYWLASSTKPWQPKDKAQVFNGYERQEVRLPEHGKWVYIGP